LATNASTAAKPSKPSHTLNKSQKNDQTVQIASSRSAFTSCGARLKGEPLKNSSEAISTKSIIQHSKKANEKQKENEAKKGDPTQKHLLSLPILTERVQQLQ
jgi:hypothetical protein